MENNFEENIPIQLIVIVFIFLMIVSFLVKSKLRSRKLKRDGQVFGEKGEILPIEKRLEANKEWLSGRIKSSGLGLMIALWLGAVVWNLTFGVSFVNSLSNSDMKTGGKVMLGLFSLGGFVFLYFAIKQTLRHFRYGSSICVIDGKAGVLGQKMTGKIITSVDVRPTSEYQLNLDCLEHYEEGTGKDKTTRTRVHWTGKYKVNPLGISSRAGIPFEFDLPKFPPETAYQISRGQVNWQITVSAPTDGVDYNAIFIVPVFKME